MSVLLEIRDGNPWYLSTDVWVVPGDDPNGPPGIPIAGANAYLWARVQNNGTDRVQNATVRFYWANPSVGFDRTTANLIGSAFVSLNAGQGSEVLCLVPWVPVIVNDGHECVLAEAFHPVDPLPASPDFNVPTDRHVAQRNLSVVVALRAMIRFSFEIHNPRRIPQAFTIRARQGELREIEALLKTIGPKFRLPKEGRLNQLGFVTELCPGENSLGYAKPVLEQVKVGGNSRVGATLVGKISSGAALIHVTQELNDKPIGGLSVLAISDEEVKK